MSVPYLRPTWEGLIEAALRPQGQKQTAKD